MTSVGLFFASKCCLLRCEPVILLLRCNQRKRIMIDISQLTSLISAFRIETEKESISPETVGKLLQDIADLLSPQ